MNMLKTRLLAMTLAVFMTLSMLPLAATAENNNPEYAATTEEAATEPEEATEELVAEPAREAEIPVVEEIEVAEEASEEPTVELAEANAESVALEADPENSNSVTARSYAELKQMLADPQVTDVHLGFTTATATSITGISTENDLPLVVNGKKTLHMDQVMHLTANVDSATKLQIFKIGSGADLTITGFYGMVVFTTGRPGGMSDPTDYEHIDGCTIFQVGNGGKLTINHSPVKALATDLGLNVIIADSGSTVELNDTNLCPSAWFKTGPWEHVFDSRAGELDVEVGHALWAKSGSNVTINRSDLRFDRNWKNCYSWDDPDPTLWAEEGANITIHGSQISSLKLNSTLMANNYVYINPQNGKEYDVETYQNKNVDSSNDMWAEKGSYIPFRFKSEYGSALVINTHDIIGDISADGKSVDNGGRITVGTDFLKDITVTPSERAQVYTESPYRGRFDSIESAYDLDFQLKTIYTIRMPDGSTVSSIEKASEIGSATESITIPASTFDQEGTYSVFVSTVLVDATRKNNVVATAGIQTITVVRPSRVSIGVLNGSATLSTSVPYTGGTITCNVTGVPESTALNYQWLKQSGYTQNFDPIPGATSNTLTLPEMDAKLLCLVTADGFDGAIYSEVFTVEPQVTVTWAPEDAPDYIQTDVYGRWAGMEPDLTREVYGPFVFNSARRVWSPSVNTVRVHYWTEDGKQDGYLNYNTSGSASQGYSYFETGRRTTLYFVPYFNLAEIIMYQVEVWNGDKLIGLGPVLQVNEQDSFVNIPDAILGDDQVVFLDEEFEMAVEADGEGLKYDWYFVSEDHNGVEEEILLPASNSAEVQLLADSSYFTTGMHTVRVRVTDRYGQTAEEDATIYVHERGDSAVKAPGFYQTLVRIGTKQQPLSDWAVAEQDSVFTFNKATEANQLRLSIYAQIRDVQTTHADRIDYHLVVYHRYSGEAVMNQGYSQPHSQLTVDPSMEIDISALEPDEYTFRVVANPVLQLEGEETATGPYLHFTFQVFVVDIGFTDVLENQWYYNAVNWAVGNGITAGYEDNTFRPDNTCTRAQIVQFLYNQAGKPAYTNTESPFTDVQEGAWYYDAVLWAVENNITSGMGGGIFGVNNPCTREQAVTFLWNAQGKLSATSTEGVFTDVPVGQWYYDSVMWAVENKVTAGIGGGLFGVGNPCTRAAIVQFLYNLKTK